jgi:tetratricopeptide (TPR) repeat protein
MYNLFRFSQKRGINSGVLSAKKKAMSTAQSFWRSNICGLSHGGQRLLGNNRFPHEKMIKPWLSPLLGEKVDATQVLQTRRSQHKMRQLMVPFSARALVEEDLFLAIGEPIRRADQQLIRTNLFPVFQATKRTSRLSRGDDWSLRWKQGKNNADISAFYQTYRLYSSLPRQEKRMIDEGKKTKLMRSKWAMFFSGLGILLLLAFIYQMKELLVFAETTDKLDIQLIGEAIALFQQNKDTCLAEIYREHEWLEYTINGLRDHSDGDLDNALASYNAALELNPNLAEILTVSGLIWSAKGDLDKALLVYGAALILNPNDCETLIKRGFIWQAKGDLDKALLDYDAALILNPNDNKTLISRGLVLLAKGDLDKALLDYNAVLAVNPNDNDALSDRGFVWLAKGNLDKALSDFDVVLSLNPKNDQAFTDRGLAWQAKGDLDKALLDYDEALKLNPKNNTALNKRGLVWQVKGNLDKALSDYNAALAINPKDDSAFYSRGNVWRDKGDLNKALLDYDKSLKFNPKNYKALANRGFVWQIKGNLGKALLDYDEFLKFNPKHDVTLNNRGLVWRAKGNLEKALSDYNSALAINPKNGEAFYNRGQVWRDKGNLDKALSDYNAAIAINPKDDQAFNNRGAVWSTKGDLDKALLDYNSALAINPENGGAFYNRGQVWQDKGNLDKALSDFGAALALDPKYDLALGNRGLVWRAKGNLDKALSDFDAALALNPKYDKTLTNRGLVLYEKGNLEKALSDYNSALAINPKNGEAFYNRGKVWQDKGNLEKALSDYNAALALNPEYSDALNSRGNIWSDKGDLEKALSDYNAALVLNSKDVAVFNNRGAVWWTKGNLEKALSDYNAALALNPEYSDALSNRGLVWCAKDNLEKALLDFDAALALNPEHSGALNNRGKVWRDTGKWDKALKDYNKVLGIKPDMEQALFGRGVVWQAKGELTKARDDYKATLEINPEHLGALFNRAVIFAYWRDLDGAGEELDKLLSLDGRYQYTKEAKELLELLAVALNEEKRTLSDAKAGPELLSQEEGWLNFWRKKPSPIHKMPNPDNNEHLEALRKEQVRLVRDSQKKYDLFNWIEKGEKNHVDEVIDRKEDLEQPNITIHDTHLTYQMPIRKAGDVWYRQRQEKNRYAIFEALLKHRCVSHTCFNREILDELMRRGREHCPEKIQRPQDIIPEIFTKMSEDVKKEAAINLYLSNALGRNWADVYIRGRRDLAILRNHPYGIPVAENKKHQYTAHVAADGSQGTPLGWHIGDSLLLRFKAYYLLMMAYEKTTPTPESQQELALLKKETVIVQNLFRDTEVSLMLRNVANKEANKKALILEHAKNLVQRIKQTENKEYMIWSGYEGHTLFVDVIKQVEERKAGEPDHEKYYLKLSNLGAGVDHHQYEEISEKRKYYPCLLNEKGWNEQELETYLQQMIEARTDKNINKREALNKIYAGVTQCVDHRSETTKLDSALKEYTATWEADKKQLTTNCVIRSCDVSTKSRLNRISGFFKVCDDHQVKMSDFLDRYGLG